MKEKVSSFPRSFDTVLSKEFDMQGEILSGGEEQKYLWQDFCSR